LKVEPPLGMDCVWLSRVHCTPWQWHGYATTCRGKVTIVSHTVSPFSWYFN